MKRRNFIKYLGASTVMVGGGLAPLPLWADTQRSVKLTILHTNDVHSRIEPFESGRNAGKGGAARRAAAIDQIRREEEHVLLFDSGDIFQGTPYFNLYGGELEFKLMSQMKYDAATIGNHDFDAGIEGLEKQLPHADFPFVISNYDFTDTVMAGRTRPYQVFRKGPLKIGVFGLGIALNGLVPKVLYQETRCLDPLEKAREMVTLLRGEERCDYVMCLSHLGYQYRDNTISDIRLAQSVTGIDLILGGHTHTFLDAPTVVKNPDGDPVLVNQAGWAGIILGRLDIFFAKKGKNTCIHCENLLVGGTTVSTTK